MKTCATCKYFNHDGSESTEGLCIFNPPVVVIDRVEIRVEAGQTIHDYFYTAVFPPVSLSDGCGFHSTGEPGG